MAKHTAKSILSPEVEASPEQLVVEAHRAISRLKKRTVPPTWGEALAELGPTASRLAKAAEAIEAKREKPVKVALRPSLDDLDDEPEEESAEVES